MYVYNNNIVQLLKTYRFSIPSKVILKCLGKGMINYQIIIIKYQITFEVLYNIIKFVACYSQIVWSWIFGLRDEKVRDSI